MKGMALFVILLAVTLFTACQTNSPGIIEQNPAPQGTLNFKLDVRQAPQEVQAIEGYLANEQDTIRFQFTIADSYAVAEVNDIPIGYWTLTVNALDADGKVIYSGSTEVYVAPGMITPVYLQLNPVNGSLRIIVTWGDTHPDLIAYFPFDGHLNDRSAFQNNALDHGGVTFVPGKLGQAVNFDGIDDYLEIPHLDIYNLEEKTIAFWFYKNNDSIRETPGEAADVEMMVIKGPNTSLELDFSFHIGTPTPPFNMNLLFTVPAISNQILLREFDVIQPQTWYFAAGVFKKNKVELYLNGEKILEADSVANFNHQQYPILVGGVVPIGNAANRMFNGKIDELIILGHAADGPEIYDLYVNGVSY
ncbi:LamG-like jellyroll fold domain-containing protein [Caldithrix abyssi]